jgi:predicted Zn-dependent peptidase
MYLGLETSDSLSDFYGFQEIDKEEIMNPEDLEIKLRAVTREEVQKVAQDIYNLHKVNFAVIGPHAGKESAWSKLLC